MGLASGIREIGVCLAVNTGRAVRQLLGRTVLRRPREVRLTPESEVAHGGSAVEQPLVSLPCDVSGCAHEIVEHIRGNTCGAPPVGVRRPDGPTPEGRPLVLALR